MVRSGSERAFEEIARRYRRQLLVYCMNRLGRGRAEDALQQTFMQAYVALKRGGEKKHIALRPWLYRIAHNCSVDLLRKNGWDHEQLDPEYDGVAQPPRLVEQKEEIRGLVESIRSLPETQRRALTLRELEGRSYREIGSELGHSESSIRQLIFRGRSALRKVGMAALVPFTFMRDRLMLGTSALTDQAAVATSIGSDPASVNLPKVGTSLLAGFALLASGGAAGEQHRSVPEALVAPDRADQLADGTLAQAGHVGARGNHAAKAKRGKGGRLNLARTARPESGASNVDLQPIPGVPGAAGSPGPATGTAPIAPAGPPGIAVPTEAGRQPAHRPAPAGEPDRADRPQRPRESRHEPRRPDLAPKQSVPRKTGSKSIPTSTPRQSTQHRSARGGPTGGLELAPEASDPDSEATQGPTRKGPGLARGPAWGRTR